MQPEIEAKFLHLSHDDVRAQLETIGAELEAPMRLMRRIMFDYPDKRLEKANWGRVRVRDEGDKVTLTYKSGGSNEYSDEIETTVGSYEAARDLLLAIGLKDYSFQESKRETWKLGDVEVVLDEWPWLDPYIEIEGPSEPAIKVVAEKLGFAWVDAKFGNIDTAYRAQYPGMGMDETVGSIAVIRFADPIPEWLQERA